MKGIGGGGGLPSGGGGKRRPPAQARPPSPGAPEPDAALIPSGPARARALSETLEGLQRQLLSLPEGDPALAGIRARMAESQVALTNLLSLPPQGALSPDRVLSLLKGTP